MFYHHEFSVHWTWWYTCTVLFIFPLLVYKEVGFLKKTRKTQQKKQPEQLKKFETKIIRWWNYIIYVCIWEFKLVNNGIIRSIDLDARFSIETMYHVMHLSLGVDFSPAGSPTPFSHAGTPHSPQPPPQKRRLLRRPQKRTSPSSSQSCKYIQTILWSDLPVIIVLSLVLAWPTYD